jgi:DNA-binding SARP family transcriptional activator
MSELGLHLLGGLEIIRDGAPLDLPPSKKTRGLLAYLALNERPMRREQLCELLWEIPDDPRGSLRWSLSKIRKLVDDENHPRIIADRNTVAFDASDVDIDVCALHAVAENGLNTAPTDTLAALADRYRGGFLEGLDLPDFHDFYTWCIGEREHASRSQAAILRALVERLGERPEDALDYANRLVQLMPLDEEARATLIGLLLSLERTEEAQQQYRAGIEKLKDAGVESSGAMHRAWRDGREVAPNRRRATAAPQPSPSIHIAGNKRTLVGREQEVALLGELVADLPTASRARSVLIRGEPGIGKSRLLQATAALARQVGAGILKATAFESERFRPFATWNDALRRAMPDNPVSGLLGSGDRVSRDQVFAGLGALLQEHCSHRPWVILFDDVHWSDESSAAAMLYALRMNRHQPVLVIGAARESELRENEAVMQCIRGLRQENMLQEMRLESMQTNALEALIRQQTPEVDAARLSRECGGNPLMALELARAENDGGSGSSLSELVQDRLSRLDESAVDVLSWAAVLAPRIDVTILERITRLDRADIDTAIEAAEQQGILHPGERGFRFSHELVGSAIYETISTARQQAMHRTVAEMLEVDSTVDLALAADLAHHARRSGDPALAGRALVAAAKLCLRFYANDDALDLYQRGMEFADQLGDAERVCLTLELCEIRQSAAPLEDWRAAAEIYTELAEQALDHGSLPHARLGYQLASYVRWTHGQWGEAKRDSLQGERVTRTADDEAHILGMAEAAKCLAMLERDLSQADAMAMEASALAQRNQCQCPAIPFALGILRFYENRLDMALDLLEDARTLYKTQGDRIGEFLANEYLTLVDIERGDYRAALRHSRVLVDIGTRLREGSEGPLAQAMERLCCYGLEGDDSGLDEAVDTLRLADAKNRLTLVLNRLARLDIEHEKLEIARRRAAEALELAMLMARPSESLLAHLNLAAVHLKNRDIEEESQRDAIAELLAGPVAGWARDLAARLLDDVEERR